MQTLGEGSCKVLVSFEAKQSDRMGGIFSEMGIYDSFQLTDHCSVYQAEVTSIQEAMMHTVLPIFAHLATP